MSEKPQKKPKHAPLPDFGVRGGRLLIGGMPVDRLADRVGSTPFYAYDRRLLTERVGDLRTALPQEVKIHYAIKANPMPAVVQHMAGLVDGFDVASGGELKTVLDTAMPVSEISFAGPGKSHDELARAVAAGIVINAESETELQTIAGIAQNQGLRPRVAVRVNPDFELKTAGMQMSGGPKQFGIDAERVPQVLNRMAEMPLDFAGFHIFSGSQNLKAEAICEAQQKTIELAGDLARHAPSSVDMLNIGGGLGIPYFPGDERLDLDAVGRNLTTLMPRAKDLLPEAEIVIELGRYLVGEAGVYVCRVVDRKESRGQIFLITDGGLHHHLAASGNFGQFVRKNYPVAVGTRMDAPAAEAVNVVGPLCTPLDVLSQKADLPRADVGDLIVVFASGAYGLTASPTAFLGHPAPAEVLV
jgi:diaminopimelate decarboxylase